VEDGADPEEWGRPLEVLVGRLGASAAAAPEASALAGRADSGVCCCRRRAPLWGSTRPPGAALFPYQGASGPGAPQLPPGGYTLQRHPHARLRLFPGAVAPRHVPGAGAGGGAGDATLRVRRTVQGLRGPLTARQDTPRMSSAVAAAWARLHLASLFWFRAGAAPGG